MFPTFVGATMDGRSRTAAYLAILAIALSVRLVAAVWWQGRVPEGERFVFPDSESYWQLARSIARGEEYKFGREEARIFRTPGYPLILAPLFAAFGDQPPVMAARAISDLLGTAAVATVMGLARTLFNDQSAWLAGLATALDPGTISLGVFVLSEAPFCPLMVLNLWAWILAWRSNSQSQALVHSAWGGAVAALAILMRPSWLLFLPFAAGIGLAFISNRRKQLAISAVMAISLALVMSPWWVRNYLVVGRFVPTTLQVGPSLYDGLSPMANGSSNMSFVPRFIDQQQVEDAAATEPLIGTFEERLDRRMSAASIEWTLANPGRAIQLAGIKFLRMWTPWPNAAEVGGFWSKLAVAAGYLPLLLLGLWGMRKYGRQDWSYALLALPAVYFTLLHMIFVSSIRYRQPAMLLIAVLAAAVLSELLSRRQPQPA